MTLQQKNAPGGSRPAPVKTTTAGRTGAVR